MAKENGQLTAAEKGKGKMEDDKTPNGEQKLDGVRKDKDGKSEVNGKKGDEHHEGMSIFQ